MLLLLPGFEDAHAACANLSAELDAIAPTEKDRD